MNKRVLVLATTYSDNNGNLNLMYIHSRNEYYAAHDVDVTVLNFAAKESYDYCGLPVISLEDYEKSSAEYDILISHAPNLRNHYKFLKKFADRFPRLVFFFHGHEVLRLRETYPPPYEFSSHESIFNRIKSSFVQDAYDAVKLRVWHDYFPSVRDKLTLVFVSGWMKSRFVRNVGLDLSDYDVRIIPNSVGTLFEEKCYNASARKDFDFVTVRSVLDGSKYCIDFVNELAKANPALRFLVIGKGEFFEHYEKAENITLVQKRLRHDEILAALDSAKCALMPTRLDAQGVMTCEMASYGIPVITSDIDICREISAVLDNIILIENDRLIELLPLLKRAEELAHLPKNGAYFAENTVGLELALINE